MFGIFRKRETQRGVLPKITGTGDKSSDLDYLADFLSTGGYGDGMNNIAIAYLYREKAIQGLCSFFDPAYVGGNVSRLNEQLAGQDSNILVTAPISVYSDPSLAPTENREAYLDLFKNTLNAIDGADKTDSFKKIFIPIGCFEPGKAGHNIALVLEKSIRGYKATLVDQMGGASYADAKVHVIQALQNIGVDVDYNRAKMSDNRMDCATFVSLLCTAASEGVDIRKMVKNSDERYRIWGQDWVSTEDIDTQYQQDKDLLHNAALRLAGDLIIENPLVVGLPNPQQLLAKRMSYRATERCLANCRGNFGR